MDITSFIAQYGIKLTHKPYPNYIGRMTGSHYKVTMTLGKKALHTEYHKGSAHNGSPPTVAEVLDCLVSEGTDQAFREWASDYCMDIEDAAGRREARKTWKTCVRIREKLKFLLGECAFQTLIEDVERL